MLTLKQKHRTMRPNKAEMENRLVVGLDIGTSTVTFVVCEENPNGIEMLGLGQSPTEGMQQGMVSNIDALIDSIQEAKSVAEQMSMREIDRVCVGVTGPHIRGTNSTGVVAIRGNEVTGDDINRVSEAAQAVPISSGEKLLHILSQQYIVDGQSGIRHPLGMCGVRLEAKVHVVTGGTSSIENLLKCIRSCDLEVEGIIMNHIASGQAVLSEDEKALGVALLDIGDGTTDFAVYSEGSIVHSATITAAGSQVTQDIAVSLHTSRDEANRIKKLYGSAYSRKVDYSESFELTVIGEFRLRKASRRFLAEVIEARLTEIFSRVRENLEQSGQYELIRSGVVLTGGTSKVVDIVSSATDILGVPVRLGAANYTGELSELVSDPTLATGLGLCEYGSMVGQQETDLIGQSELRKLQGSPVDRVANFIRRLFMREDSALLQPHQ